MCKSLKRMAGVEGLEPPTLGLEIRCSIRLSYTPATAPFILSEEVRADVRDTQNSVNAVRRALRKMAARKMAVQGCRPASCSTCLLVSETDYDRLRDQPRGPTIPCEFHNHSVAAITRGFGGVDVNRGSAPPTAL